MPLESSEPITGLRPSLSLRLLIAPRPSLYYYHSYEFSVGSCAERPGAQRLGVL